MPVIYDLFSSCTSKLTSMFHMNIERSKGFLAFLDFKIYVSTHPGPWIKTVHTSIKNVVMMFSMCDVYPC